MTGKGVKTRGLRDGQSNHQSRPGHDQGQGLGFDVDFGHDQLGTGNRHRGAVQAGQRGGTRTGGEERLFRRSPGRIV